jgi:nucleoside-diphosphate-sugar epimerase
MIARICSKFNKSLFSALQENLYCKIYSVDETSPDGNPYGSSKVAGEKIIEAYSKCYGLNYIILRLANVYGKKITTE